MFERKRAGARFLTGAVVLLTLAACGSGGGDPVSDDGAQGVVPTATPTLRPGEPGGQGDDTATHGTRSGGHGSTPRAIDVAGPTINNDFPEYWGNIYRDQPVHCANFTFSDAVSVTLVSVTVNTPLRVHGGCAGGDPNCVAGIVVPQGQACGLGLTFSRRADLHRDYPHIAQVWTLRAACTSTDAPPCTGDAVAAAHPSPTKPVVVTWKQSMRLRYCGGTDYANDEGFSGGRGTSPTNGCSGAAPPSSAAPDDGTTSRAATEPAADPSDATTTQPQPADETTTQSQPTGQG